jgi:hypothetical protein
VIGFQIYFKIFLDDVVFAPYKFKRLENFKYLRVILIEDNNHQIHVQEKIKNANEVYAAEFKKK